MEDNGNSCAIWDPSSDEPVIHGAEFFTEVAQQGLEDGSTSLIDVHTHNSCYHIRLNLAAYDFDNPNRQDEPSEVSLLQQGARSPAPIRFSGSGQTAVLNASLNGGPFTVTLHSPAELLMVGGPLDFANGHIMCKSHDPLSLSS